MTTSVHLSYRSGMGTVLVSFKCWNEILSFGHLKRMILCLFLAAGSV